MMTSGSILAVMCACGEAENEVAPDAGIKRRDYFSADFFASAARSLISFVRTNTM